MHVNKYVLPFDVSRCRGVTDEPNCKVCLRNQPGHTTRQFFIEPAINDGKCENLYLDEVNENVRATKKEKSNTDGRTS